MKIGKIKLVTIAMACTFGLVACDKPHNAENAGKEIDRAAEKASTKMDPTSDKLGKQTTETGIALEDSAITTKVKAAILGESGLKSLDIKVETVNGVVTLAGKVGTQANSDKAKQIAGGVSEVKEVKNQLEIK
jgi:hyperosmotically inducible protein